MTNCIMATAHSAIRCNEGKNGLLKIDCVGAAGNDNWGTGLCSSRACACTCPCPCGSRDGHVFVVQTGQNKYNNRK